MVRRPRNTSVTSPQTVLAEMRTEPHADLATSLARATTGPALVTALVCPTSALSLGAALAAAQAGLIVPVLVGPSAAIRRIAEAGATDITRLRLVDAPDASAAAIEAVRMARTGEVAALMKGDLHTDQLMRPIGATQTGLRTTRHMSHVYVLRLRGQAKLVLLTDVAINVAPSLADKAGIVRNAIDLAHALGFAEPRVAILSAVETVNADMPSTVDAASLCKMADRGQITGGLTDGPLAFDDAIDAGAAAAKGIVSEVAGRADILVAPDLEAGNILAKALTVLAGAEAAGVVVGASVPIVLTSRADGTATRVASCALARLMGRSMS